MWPTPMRIPARDPEIAASTSAKASTRPPSRFYAVRMMKRAGVLLVVLGVVQLFGNAMQGRIPDQVLIVGAMMVIGGVVAAILSGPSRETPDRVHPPVAAP